MVKNADRCRTRRRWLRLLPFGRKEGRKEGSWTRRARFRCILITALAGVRDRGHSSNRPKSATRQICVSLPLPLLLVTVNETRKRTNVGKIVGDLDFFPEKVEKNSFLFFLSVLRIPHSILIACCTFSR